MDFCKTVRDGDFKSCSDWRTEDQVPGTLTRLLLGSLECPDGRWRLTLVGMKAGNVVVLTLIKWLG